MPIPHPRAGEESKDFMARCMGNEVMVREFPEADQRAAVCHRQLSKSIRWDRAFTIACACCKADGANVPEVEAVIVILLALVRDAYSVALLSALLGRPRAALSEGALQAVEQAAASLARVAAENHDLPIPLDVNEQAALAAQRLQVQLNALVQEARQAPPAAPGATVGPVSPEALRSELEAALNAEQALRPLVDTWSYQTFNAGTVRATAANGENFIKLVAKIDSRTTMFCRLVNGRVIPMARALAQLDRINAATLAGDSAALISAAPFHPNPSQATQEEVDAILAIGGLAPFHHGCRTQNVPIRL
jgi:hypothetical protein